MLQSQSSQNPASSGSAGNGMHQFVSVIHPKPCNTLPAEKSSLQEIDGIPWLTFSYKTRTKSDVFTVRVDVDSVDLDQLSLEFKRVNCIYPSANGPECDYKGVRRDYERQCNEQAWRLAHLNPAELGDKRGVLGRAVVEMRNMYLDTKSRRERRQEAVRNGGRERVDNANNLRFRSLGPTMELPKARRHLTHSRHNDLTRTRPAQPLVWQPAMIFRSPHMVSTDNTAQTPSASGLSQTYAPVAQDLPTQDVTPPSCGPTVPPEPSLMDARSCRNRFPVLGTFPHPSSTLHSDLLEFEGFIQGRFTKLSIRHDIDCVQVNEIPFDFKRDNCVYPRSFMVDEDESQSWNSAGIRRAEESYLNEIGWKLASGILSPSL
ncbi:hypothetical protein BGZ98_000392 [Dissophora globulifera]|nr:hypothetical protein BGZ98_000392 [Dissophora globulifera]